MSTPSGSSTKPLGYSYLISEEILHGSIPADPAAPYLPSPEVYDDFVFAMGIGWPDAMYAGVDPTEVPLQQTVVGRSGVFAHGLARSGTTDPERKPGWTYNVPEGTSVRALTAKAFAAFNWYGPIPLDKQDSDLVWNWAPSDGIKIERKVFFYQTTVSHDGRDADFDLVMSLYGAANKDNPNWIYPEKDGTIVRSLIKRGPDQWVTLFDLQQWMNDNGEMIAQAVLLIAAVAISVVTFGLAIAPMAAIYTGFQAILAGMKMLAVAIQTGDIGLAVKACIKVGQGMNAVSSGVAPAETKAAVDDIKKKFETETAAFASWGKNFAAPIADAYDKAEALAGRGGDQISTFINIAGQQARTFPLINEEYWKNAFAKVNVGGAVQLWAIRAQNLGQDQLNDFVNSVPWYAREAAGVGAAVRAAEIAQNAAPVGGGMHFGPRFQDPGRQGVMQLPPEMAKWTKPDPSLKARGNDIGNFIKSPGSYITLPQYTPASTATKKVVIGGIATAAILYFFRDYVFGKILDKVLK